MAWLSNPEIWIALLTLTVLEIVLGIDNIVFITILTGKLPPERQPLARRLGLAAALITRIILLSLLSWIIGLTAPLFTVVGQEISGRDIILITGGLFLLGKATWEIHERLEGGHDEEGRPKAAASFASVIIQIMLLDIVFSLDSVITAVGMVSELAIMVTAVIIAVAVMLALSEVISSFVNRHPTVKMLALAFLLLIGMSLLAEGFDQEIEKGYIYSAMGFSVLVEVLNLRARRRKTAPVDLHNPYTGEDSATGSRGRIAPGT